MIFDLHCHSNVSDGALAPVEVARRAARGGVQVWALTDHDQLGGLAEAREAARAEGMHFIDGVEISVTWRGSTVHVLGLRIDPANETLAGDWPACAAAGSNARSEWRGNCKRPASMARSKGRCATRKIPRW